MLAWPLRPLWRRVAAFAGSVGDAMAGGRANRLATVVAVAADWSAGDRQR